MKTLLALLGGLLWLGESVSAQDVPDLAVMVSANDSIASVSVVSAISMDSRRLEIVLTQPPESSILFTNEQPIPSLGKTAYDLELALEGVTAFSLAVAKLSTMRLQGFTTTPPASDIHITNNMSVSARWGGGTSFTFRKLEYQCSEVRIDDSMVPFTGSRLAHFSCNLESVKSR